jgi:metal-dependent amidase/aminoacylase/carboxypeptidase family protein
MGKQTHGAYPWLGIDPIVTASQIVLGLQTIVSRNVNLRNPQLLLVWDK